MRRLLVATLLLTLAVAAPASAKRLISYERQGGFSGVPLRMTLTAGGLVRATEGAGGAAQAYRLTAKQLRGVKRLIRRADFPALERDYRPAPGTVADGFTEYVRHKGKTVVTGSGGDAPARLERLTGRLSELAQGQ